MAETPIKRNSLSVGMSVGINPQNDKTREIIVHGCIKEILTAAESHPHGILVSLETGEKGRVKSVSRGNSVTPDTEVHFEKLSVNDLLSAGENERLEIKLAALWSAKYTNEDIKNHRPQSSELHKYGQLTSKYIIAKTLAGFQNTEGGILIIGALEHKDSKIEIVGIEPELHNLKDQTTDGYRRMLIDLVSEFFSADIFNRFNQYFQITFDEIEDKTLCSIEVKRSDVRSFLSIKNHELFFVRIDASTREINGAQILDYCDKRFPS